MADKAISDLTAATSVGGSDLFVLEQNNTAKKLTGQTLMNDLATALDGHGGISSISYTAPASGSLNGTLTITLADGTVSTLTVTNGRGITSIAKTGTSGLTDTYTITYNNNTTSTFTVVNGNGVASVTQYYAVSESDDEEPSVWHDTPQTMTQSYRFLWSYQTFTLSDGTTLDTTPCVIGAYGEAGQDWYVHIKYASEEPTQDSDMGDTPDNYVGVYSGTSATAPTSYTAYTWYGWRGVQGETGNGIASITKTSTSGLVDTYTVTFTNGGTSTFNVTNGSNIQSIAKTSTNGLVDTYTVTLTNGNTTTFQVTNAKSISSIAWVSNSGGGAAHAAGTSDTYQITYNTGDAFTFDVYNGANGAGAVSSVDDIDAVGDNVPLLTIGNGAPTTATQGNVKSRYFDALNSVLYICTAFDSQSGTYTWQGTSGITVDSAMSTSSTNPLQNKVITNKVGASALITSQTNLTDAVNAHENDIGSMVLTTTATDLTGAINEHETDISGITTTLGNTALPTTAQTVTGAIAELDTDVSGKVSKSGDTMTGDLTLNNKDIIIKNTDITDGTIPSTATYGKRLFVHDANGDEIGYVSPYFHTDGKQGLVFYARRKINDAMQTAGLELGTDSSGNKYVNWTSGMGNAFRSSLGLGTSGVLPITIEQGGTGANTKDGAKLALGIRKLSLSEKALAKNSSITLPLASGTMGAIFSMRAATGNAMGFIIYRVSGTGVIYYTYAVQDASITITTGTNAFTLTNAANNGANIFILDFSDHNYT